MFQAFIHGIDQNPVAALAQELGLTLVPMDHCKLSDSDGKPVEAAMDERIQTLWNTILDECADLQQQYAAATDSRGETSDETNSDGDGSSSGESEVAETTAAIVAHMPTSAAETMSKTVPVNENCRDQDARHEVGNKSKTRVVGICESEHGAKSAGRDRGKGSVSKTPVTLGQVLEETARTRVASFSKAELELWGWHRGNLEISCGAVSGTGFMYENISWCSMAVQALRVECRELPSRPRDDRALLFATISCTQPYLPCVFALRGNPALQGTIAPLATRNSQFLVRFLNTPRISTSWTTSIGTRMMSTISMGTMW